MNPTTTNSAASLPGEAAPAGDMMILYIAIGFIVLAAIFFLWWVRAMEKRSKEEGEE